MPGSLAGEELFPDEGNGFTKGVGEQLRPGTGFAFYERGCVQDLLLALPKRIDRGEVAALVLIGRQVGMVVIPAMVANRQQPTQCGTPPPVIADPSTSKQGSRIDDTACIFTGNHERGGMQAGLRICSVPVNEVLQDAQETPLFADVRKIEVAYIEITTIIKAEAYRPGHVFMPALSIKPVHQQAQRNEFRSRQVQPFKVLYQGHMIIVTGVPAADVLRMIAKNCGAKRHGR